MSDNNVVHVEAEAHVAHPTDATEQAAGSGEGVKKNKKRHSPSDLVNVERKDGDRDAGAADDTQAERCRVIACYLRGRTRSIGGIQFMQLKM